MLRLLAPVSLLGLAACASVPAEAPPPPHVAYAWATFDADGIRRTGASGMADRAAGREITIDDPARIASITKLVLALGAMRLVEQGKLDLDRDVSDYLGWPLRNPAFPDEPITLRQLLSHRSSLRDEVDYIIPLGGTVRGTVADPRAFDPEHRPGSHFRYSNLGFPVVATAMEAAAGERFDLLMERLVLKPLGLDACFNWTGCSDAGVATAVVLYEPNGMPLRDDNKGRRPDCPVVPAADGGCDWRAIPLGVNAGIFSPQGGLRISVRDLAKIGQMLLRDGRLPTGEQLLEPASIAEMTRLHWLLDGANGESEEGFYCGYGLAVQVLAQCAPGDDPFGDGRRRVGHAGDAYRLRSGLWVDPGRGTGVAYLATGIALDAPTGRSAYRTIEEWLAARGR
jgi:CubicO group peptidase (beta-lactamase class C family)